MARANVELIVEAAKAINPLRKVEQHSKKVDQALKKNQKSVKRVEAAFVLFGRKGANALRDLEGNAARLGKRMSGLRGTVGKAVVGFVAFKSVQTGIARLESERRIQLLGKRFGEVAGLQNAAAQAAKKFKLSQTEANQSLANAFARLRPLGVSLEDITSTFGGFRTAAVLGGATAAEASAAFTQLSQALGSGALRGDEFRSIAEQAPLVLQAISDETGIAAGKLKEYAAQGLLTSDIVIKALKRIESDGAESLAQALNGPAAKIKEFQNAVEDVQVAATESAIPAITDAISELGTVIRQLEPAIRFISGLLAGVAKTVGNIVEGVSSGGKTTAARLAAEQAATLQTNNKFGKPGPFGRSTEAQQFREEVLERELSRRLAIARGAVPGQLPPSAADIGETPKGTSPITFKPKTKTKTGLSSQEQARKAGEERLQSLKDQALIISGITEEERTMLELETNIADINRDRNVLGDDLANKLIAAEQNLVRQKIVAQSLTQEEKNRMAVADKLAQEMQKQKEFAAQIGQTIKEGITNSILDAVEGSKSLGESLSGILRQLGGMFLSAGIGSFGTGGQAGSGLLGAIKFAEGGVVNKPTNALIGEGGEPEYVIPQSKMRESMSRYSRGSRGGGVIPDNRGGSASGDGDVAVAAPIDVRYTVERINSVDYVTADQFQSGMQSAAAQGAQRGEQNTLKRLQMSGSTRRRLGM